MKKINGFKNDFKMCPMCGCKQIENHGNRKWMCPDCGFDLYNNVATAVGLIIQDKNKNVLFEVRAKEPRKGFYAVPGGFVDFDESAEEAAIRECREEIICALRQILMNIRILNTKPVTFFSQQIFRLSSILLMIL